MSIVLVIDGGTTNLRVSAVDTASRRILAQTAARGGVRHTAMDGNNSQLKEALQSGIRTVCAQIGSEAEKIGSCIAYGMITSNAGLYEIPHLTAPADITDLRNGMISVNFPDLLPIPIRFIPGVKNASDIMDRDGICEMDMMRGEETEAIGLFNLLKPTGEVLFVLPGSHNKMIRMSAAGHIVKCMTSVSGELLDAITHHTLLSASVAHDFCTEASYDRSFAVRGALECARTGLGRAAFTGRVLNILSDAAVPEIQSWLLGAVLMEDVRAMRAFMGNTDCAHIYVAGKPPVQSALCDVMEAVGISAVSVNAEISARMGIHGALLIAGL